MLAALKPTGQHRHARSRQRLHEARRFLECRNLWPPPATLPRGTGEELRAALNLTVPEYQRCIDKLKRDAHHEAKEARK